MTAQTSTALVIVRPRLDEMTWAVSPEEEQAVDVWVRCRDNWLKDIVARSKKGNTERAYRADWLEFFGHWRHINLMPWNVGRVHAQGWVQAMRDRGLADSTINRKVAALSSYYHYASDEFQIMGPTGPKGLWAHPNPFGSKKLRTVVDPYSRALPSPTSEQVTELFKVIPTDTPQGLRDLSLIMGLFVTTRRVTEWTSIRWGDLSDADGGGKIMKYRYKGGKIKKQKIDQGLWRLIEEYLKASGRWPLQADDDPIFIALSDTGRRLECVRPDYDPTKQPISSRHVNGLLKSYGRKAGIPVECLHAHALRHAGARFRRKNGADVYDLKDLLGHSSIAITQIYTDNVLEQPEDDMAAMIVSQVMPKQLKMKFAR